MNLHNMLEKLLQNEVSRLNGCKEPFCNLNGSCRILKIKQLKGIFAKFLNLEGAFCGS